MNRREWLRATTASASLPLLTWEPAEAEAPPMVMTVLGPINPADLGTTLPHEHIILDTANPAIVSPERYDEEEVVDVVLPHLEVIRGLGCDALCDCTPAYLGRDPSLLARLSQATGLHILTNTGYYNAAGGKHLPDHARDESAERLAERWAEEWERGIAGSGIKPGFIKIGVDAGPLPGLSRKLVRATARTHLRTGLVIACHCGDGRAAREGIEILRAEGVDPSAFIWVHAQNEKDADLHAEAAGLGAWIEFDAIGPSSIEEHVSFVRRMKDRGQLGRVLLSHDAGWYQVGEPGGGPFRPYDTLFEQFLPALQDAGFSEGERTRLTVSNPAEAFSIRVRPAR
ncbi:phosphotriesterase family protein [Tautonia plasticadhaerens]|uniref:Phosphotriesterase n=1 Tax=Tautonia plasticadhaerens TaxID=2527974 RepID=A0A518GXA1_9BACT|nr:phosphotriesterase [Tautonia plasticadhaerens]QDV33215.1 hypothetical protein ElP_10570 [Tautonia plasticadhaerens]